MLRRPGLRDTRSRLPLLWGGSKVDGNRLAAFASFVVGFAGVEGFVEGCVWRWVFGGGF